MTAQKSPDAAADPESSGRGCLVPLVVAAIVAALGLGAFLAFSGTGTDEVATDADGQENPPPEPDPEEVQEVVDEAVEAAEGGEIPVGIARLPVGPEGETRWFVTFLDPDGGVSYSIFGVVGEGRDDSVDTERAHAGTADVTEDVANQAGNNTSYPCGARTADYIVTCQDGAGPFPSGEFVVVVVEHAGPIAGGEGEYTYGLAFDDDGDPSDNLVAQPPFDADLFAGTEYFYRLQIDPDGTRTMWADGVVDGVPGVPRQTDGFVHEQDTILTWWIPRAEVPGDQLGIRVTAFRDGNPVPGVAPDPAMSGGDMIGGGPDEPLLMVDGPVVVFDDVDALPPDTETVIPRVEITGSPDAHRARVLIDGFSARMDAALASGSVDAVVDLVHPILLAGPTGAECRRQVEESIALADAVRLGAAPEQVDLSAGLPVYGLTAEIDYPTGTVAWGPQLVPGPRGELFLFLPCV